LNKTPVQENPEGAVIYSSFKKFQARNADFLKKTTVFPQKGGFLWNFAGFSY